MTVEQTRRARLEQLIERAGGPTKFARAINANPNYITQLRNAKKSFGSQAARKMEKAAGEPAGWMDTPQQGAAIDVVPTARDLRNDIQALRYAVGAMAAIMAGLRPAEGAAVAALFRARAPREFVDDGLGFELLKVLDAAAASPSVRRAKSG